MLIKISKVFFVVTPFLLGSIFFSGCNSAIQAGLDTLPPSPYQIANEKRERAINKLMSREDDAKICALFAESVGVHLKRDGARGVLDDCIETRQQAKKSVIKSNPKYIHNFIPISAIDVEKYDAKWKWSKLNEQGRMHLQKEERQYWLSQFENIKNDFEKVAIFQDIAIKEAEEQRARLAKEQAEREQAEREQAEREARLAKEKAEREAERVARLKKECSPIKAKIQQATGLEKINLMKKYNNKGCDDE